MFMLTLIGGGTLLYAYVAWRAASVPLLARRCSRRTRLVAGLVLWACLVLCLYLGHGASGRAARLAEIVGMTAFAGLFLASVTLLPVDLLTGFGLLLRRRSAAVRGWALVAGSALTVFALVQGVRPPTVSRYQVPLPGLPADLDGTVVVALSDLHLGSTLGESWLAARLAQVEALRPDLVVFLGDVFEGHGSPSDAVLSDFRALTPPLGAWAVTGNHEFHRHSGASSDALEEAGFSVLHDRWVALRPGLVLAGVDDLTSRHRAGDARDLVAAALAGRPPGATILLSHTPWGAETAAAAGAGVMLCGHTHGGQVWPFGLLVRRVYPLLAGAYRVAGMPVIVSRGTGTWGPRMRLWQPGEILRITLRATSDRSRAPGERALAVRWRRDD